MRGRCGYRILATIVPVGQSRSGCLIDLPEAFVSADEASLKAQQHFLASTRTQLLLLVVAGVAGVVDWETSYLDLGSLVAALAFTLAAVLRVILIRRPPHRAWYEGRAAAESVKTLSWRYAVGGEPFLTGNPESLERWQEQVRSIFDGLDGIATPGPPTPTPSMERLRAEPLPHRKTGYSEGRIRDQLHWYSRKADWNRRRARSWSVTILALQVLAAVGAFLLAFQVMEVDLFGLAGALVASGAAWVETKQHATIANAYRVAAEELERIAALIDDISTEEDWGRFVADSEEAISREHTMWKASSSRLRPPSLI